ncbi:MAG: hypothetical protein GX488_04415 [Clostridiales bacterium]|nr:hypothetical protein [Clostridiales bacterium]
MIGKTACPVSAKAFLCCGLPMPDKSGEKLGVKKERMRKSEKTFAE